MKTGDLKLASRELPTQAVPIGRTILETLIACAVGYGCAGLWTEIELDWCELEEFCGTVRGTIRTLDRLSLCLLIPGFLSTSLRGFRWRQAVALWGIGLALGIGGRWLVQWLLMEIPK